MDEKKLLVDFGKESKSVDRWNDPGELIVERQERWTGGRTGPGLVFRICAPCYYDHTEQGPADWLYLSVPVAKRLWEMLGQLLHSPRPANGPGDEKTRGCGVYVPRVTK